MPSLKETTHAPAAAAALPEVRLILRFDVEEHFRIEAAANQIVEPPLCRHYGECLGPSTGWLLEKPTPDHRAGNCVPAQPHSGH